MHQKPPPSMYEATFVSHENFIPQCIQTLKNEINRNKSHALETFWSDVELNGTPLIEPDPDNPDYCFVIFLWREEEAVTTNNVLVLLDTVTDRSRENLNLS